MCIQTLNREPVKVKFCPAVYTYLSNFNVSFCHKCPSRTEMFSLYILHFVSNSQLKKALP